ncbi:MAG: CueP family metal-binding protein [Candidatus Izemoplasmatales bacterium]|nr:CueP family metal-binding protein [Candidatus Izemoplasmatales bacterium]
MKRFLIGLGLIGLLLVGVTITNQITKKSALQKAGLANLEITELIERLENNEFTGEVKSSITDQEVRILIEDYEYKFALPEDMLYISFAPFISLTHECYTHSLTGCQGEMVNQEVYVRIYDLDGNVVSEGFENTGEDGFIGLFLDSNEKYKILVSANFLSNEFLVDGNLDQTCFTEVELT